jgi:hypothetical protein
MNVTIIIEGGLVRAAYLNGEYIDPEVFDFDLEGQDETELEDLLDRIDASPKATKLRTDLLTWRTDVQRALSYGDGMGA